MLQALESAQEKRRDTQASADQVCCVSCEKAELSIRGSSSSNNEEDAAVKHLESGFQWLIYHLNGSPNESRDEHFSHQILIEKLNLRINFGQFTSFG
jgi:hypothetical protein